MMYTPTPHSRRPKPPSSTKSRSRTPASPITNDMSSHDSDTTLVASGSTTSDTTGTPLAEYARRRRLQARAPLSRISASPGTEVGEVSMTLDHRPSSVTRSGLGIGLPSPLATTIASAHVEPSPPPPYGQELPDDEPIRSDSASTPPRQDSGHPSRRTSTTPSDGNEAQEEKLRLRRATDAARAMGLDIDFGMQSASASGDESEEMSESEIKRQLRSAKKRLKQRDNELLMAAQIAEQALRTHEELLNRLSPQAQERLPEFLHLLASVQTPSSSSRPTPRATHSRRASSRSIASIASVLSPANSGDASYFTSIPGHETPLRTMRFVEGLPVSNRKASRPKALKTRVDSPTQKELYYAQLQQAEMDQRIAELEAALAEAQSGESNQRKAVARLRKENDKVQRELEKAERRLSDAGTLRNITSRQRWQWGQRTQLRIDDKVPWRTNSIGDTTSHGTDEEEADVSWITARPAPIPAPPSASSSRLSRVSDRVDELLDKLEHMSASTGRSRSVSPTMLDTNEVDQSTLRSSQPSSLPRSESKISNAPSLHIALPEGRRLRKKVSASSFLSPSRATQRSGSMSPRPVTPTVTVEPPVADTPASLSRKSLSTLQVRQTRSRTLTPSPAKSLASLASLATRFSLSPGYTSLSERMASMRDFVSDHLEKAAHRSLGSEMGSEYGSLTPLREVPTTDPSTPSAEQASTSQEWVDEVVVDDVAAIEKLLAVTEPDSTPFTSPAALPPQISAALSSIALAMRPGGMWDRSNDAQDLSRDEQYSITTQGRHAIWSGLRSTPRAARIRRTPKRYKYGISPIPRQETAIESNEWEDVTDDSLGSLRDAKGKGRADLISRPHIERAGSSSSTVALAHRRVTGNPVATPIETSVADLFSPVISEHSEHRIDSPLANSADTRQSPTSTTTIPIKENSLASRRSVDEYDEPLTIPGRLVHDVWVWAIILFEWAVCLLILFVRMGIDLNEGKKGIMARNRKDKRRRRYYL